MKPITWYSADLKEVMRLSAEYVEGLLDADRDYEPFFYVMAGGYGNPAVATHELEIGIPHVTGRAIDCLFNVELKTGRKIDCFAEDIYTKYYYSCMEEIGLPVFYDKPNNRHGVESHNMRESCEALAWLIRSRNDDRARRLADRFLSVLQSIMPDHCGYIQLDAVIKSGLSGWIRGDCNSPLDTGRLIGALLNLYDACGDERALTLAGDISKNATRWFDPKTGSMANACAHIHSITSTLSGILEYAYLTNNKEMVDLVRAVYEGAEGLPLVIHSTGWIKEQVKGENEVRGEVNQVGDVIQMQMMFAKHEKSERAAWYGLAESFMRSALLPAQVLDNTFFTVNNDPNAGDAYANMAQRALGGFGFPMPSAHLQSPSAPINTIDITQGAVQAISYFTNHIAYMEEGALWINLLFGWENEVAKVESCLPLFGKVKITSKQDGAAYIRAYNGVPADKIRVSVNGGGAKFTYKDGYIALKDVCAGDVIDLDFDIESKCYTETFYRGMLQECEYTIHKYGEQVVAVTPIIGVYPLYEGWPLEIEGLDLTEKITSNLTEEMKARGYRAFVPLDAHTPDVTVRGAARYDTDNVRGKCLCYTQANTSTDELGILVDMFFDCVKLNPSTDSLAFWLYIDDPTNTTPLTVEYASRPINAGEEMFQCVIDLPTCLEKGTLKIGWNPIVMPLDLQKSNFPVQINANNSPNFTHIFRIRLMNKQSDNGKPLTYKLSNVAFIRGEALEDYAK